MRIDVSSPRHKQFHFGNIVFPSSLHERGRVDTIPFIYFCTVVQEQFYSSDVLSVDDSGFSVIISYIRIGPAGQKHLCNIDMILSYCPQQSRGTKPVGFNVYTCASIDKRLDEQQITPARSHHESSHAVVIRSVHVATLLKQSLYMAIFAALGSAHQGRCLSLGGFRRTCIFEHLDNVLMTSAFCPP